MKNKIQLEGEEKIFVSMLKRNMREGISVEQKISGILSSAHPCGVEIILFGKVLLPSESAKAPSFTL